MNRYALLFLAATGLVFAQDPNSGGWRRVGDRPPAQAPAAPPQGQDPEPVDRSDAYGQPVQQSAPPVQADRDEYPQQGPQQGPRYGVPPEIVVRPGTYMTVRLGQ